ncbi:MAG: hypothetical protein F6K65_03470 [Moorea sp. SIO3C2]|nr:hypothetical protein [Moorena sp. SIO3C2]
MSLIKLAEYPNRWVELARSPHAHSFAERLCKSRVSVGVCHQGHNLLNQHRQLYSYRAFEIEEQMELLPDFSS